tara:strand:- start:2868 stop:3101 length:234 start_codon:yes stop_codon:yes gene_type:complete
LEAKRLTAAKTWLFTSHLGFLIGLLLLAGCISISFFALNSIEFGIHPAFIGGVVGAIYGVTYRKYQKRYKANEKAIG